MCGCPQQSVLGIPALPCLLHFTFTTLKRALAVLAADTEGQHLLQSPATVTCFSHLLQSPATVTCYSHLLQSPATVTCYSYLLQSPAPATSHGQRGKTVIQHPAKQGRRVITLDRRLIPYQKMLNHSKRQYTCTNKMQISLDATKHIYEAGL